MKHFVGLVVTGALLAGCYTMEPARGITPETGTAVAFDISDVGRVALGGSMGPEIARIEGRLLSKDAEGDYEVAVTGVTLLRGGQQVWKGEHVTIKPTYISTTYLKKYSTGRTVALSAIGVAAVVAIASVAIIGSGDIEQQKPDTGGGVLRRLPLPHKLPPRGLRLNFPPTAF
jgi:hypothetical protein